MLRWRVWAMASILLVLLAQPVLAQGGEGGRVVFAQNVTIRTGERLNGDLVAFGGNVTLEPGSAVRGSVLAFGGRVRIDGQVTGDVFALGGNVDMSATGSVGGDVVAAGGTVRNQGARVGGRVMGDVGPGLGVPMPGLGRGTSFFWGPRWNVGWPWGMYTLGEAFSWMVRTVLGTLTMLALGVLVVLLIPNLTRTTSQAFVTYPVQSVGVGLLTWLVAILAVPLLVITCLGIPVAVVAVAALAIAVLFGWIVAGLALGERVMAALKQAGPQPPAAVAVGLLILSALSAAPCLGFLVTVLVASWGLGAVVLTRFGSMPYVAAPVRAGAPPAPPVAGRSAE